MTDFHPDHPGEQAYLLSARAALESTVAHVDTLLATARRDKDNPHAQALAANLTRRLWRLRDAGAQAVCFARLDDEDQETLYIGRQHIADQEQHPLVIDWRARAAEPFYRATALNPMGCVRRRQFVLEGDDLVEIYDTDMTDPTAGAGIPDPLLAEINRARTGSMREIVATIQREQDLIVRAPLDRTLVVQGGPGTGKTAVGLHRAAYLLFEHRELLGQEGVLVVGPNRRFLEYIGDVLPSLGERTFRQVVLGDLGDIELPGSDGLARAHRMIAGDLRMASLLRGHLESVPTEPVEDVRIRTPEGGGTIEAARAADHMRDLLASGERVGPARELWMSRLIGDLRADLRGRNAGAASVTASDFASEVRKAKAFKTFVQEHWKPSKPKPAVRAMWRRVATDDAFLGRAGFTAAEVDHLRRRPARQALTEIDRPLVDEAAFQLGVRFYEYGHVILDEAQDLSPMALRMVSRRARNGSFTVLGDVAQCSGDWVYPDWDVPLSALASDRARVELAELTVGYRVPGEFIELANALLPSIAPSLTATTSVRPALHPPTHQTVRAGDFIDHVVERATQLADRWVSVAVIVPDSTVAAAVREAAPAEVDVLEPSEAKGLEFDAVLVVEPADMTGGLDAGWRPLFVALTRAVQHLELIGTRPPPQPVAAALGM